MHKAIAIHSVQARASDHARRPEYKMEDRDLLHRLDLTAGTITLPDGKTYPLKDTNFPTVDPSDPYKLTDAEAEVVEKATSLLQA